MQPARVLFERGKKLLKPRIVVAMLECAGPDVEFLHIVAHGGHVVGVGAGGFLEIGNDLLDGAKRNQVAKNFLTGDKTNRLTLIFCDVIDKKLVRLETGGEKVDIVEDSVLDIGFGKDGSELWLPDTLREPGTGGALAEMMLDIVSQTNQLHALIGVRDGDKDRLVETAANHFHLAGFHQRFQTLKIFRAILFDPGEQWTGIVEADVDPGMPLEGLNEGQIATCIGLLKNMAKIAARLMGVDEQD